MLGLVTNQTGIPYDISGMSIGTVHSICQNILIDPDRRFTIDGNRSRPPVLLDELSQYFKIYNKKYWLELLTSGGYYTGVDPDKEQEVAQREINKYLFGKDVYSCHPGCNECYQTFQSLLTEENLEPSAVNANDATLAKLLKMYSFYRESHKKGERIENIDFSLLQQKAFNKIKAFDGAQDVVRTYYRG
ncbi:MAG: hypothetical protein U5K54_15335 [Cytophagales bacterium]|nr:hypothetical protein [Cytophagales bacterium]